MNAPAENDAPWSAEVDAQQDAEADAELAYDGTQTCLFCDELAIWYMWQYPVCTQHIGEL